MGKTLITYVFITIGLIILFNAAGLPTLGNVIMEQLDLTEEGITNFQSSSFWIIYAVTAIGALALASAASLIPGVLGRGSAELGVTALYATPLLVFVGELISITLIGEGWVGKLVFLIMTPFVGAYVIALYDWVRGRD